MAGADISPFIDDELQRFQIGTAYLTLAGSHPLATEEVFVDAHAMMQKVAYIAALLVEYDPRQARPGAFA